jgi:hypothetical protein
LLAVIDRPYSWNRIPLQLLCPVKIAGMEPIKIMNSERHPAGPASHSTVP